jgi:hypothetical protein
MTEIISEEKATTKSEQWRERLSAQERSGLSVKQFCRERGLKDCTFYAWRKRLREKGPVRFALVERGRVWQEPTTEASLELVLATGERLRISAGVDGATLHTVLDALRA